MANAERIVPVFPRAGLRAALVITLLSTSLVCAAPQQDQYPWEQMEQRSFDVGEGGALMVRVDDADVAVTASSAATTDVTIQLRSNDMDWARDRYDRTNYRVRLDGDTVVVESDDEPNNSWRAGSWMSVLVEVRMPSRSDLDVDTQDGDVSIAAFEGEARISSQDGDLTIDSLRGGNIELRTQDGDVRATQLSGTTVLAISQDGDIDVDTLSGSISMYTQDGDIRVGSADSTEVELESTDGDIHVAIVSGARMNLTTRDGDISIEAPSSLQADIDLAGEEVYIQGSFSINGRVSSGRAEGNINGGGREIRARTGDGDIRLVERDAG